MKKFYLVTLVFVILLTAGCTNTIDEKKNDSKTTTTTPQLENCVIEGGRVGGAPPAPGVTPRMCCTGLKQIPAIEVGSDGKCSGGVTEIFNCAKCGDRVCGLGENKCNCPEDCGSSQIIGMPNPASVYCEKNGGKLDIRTDASSGQYGVCVFQDGKECEEWDYFRSNGTTCTSKVEKPIGGDTDEHGCLVAAGYSWNESVKACVREWELNENQKKAAKMAVEYLNPMKGVTIERVDVMRCPGCFRVNLILNLNSGDKKVSVTILNWQVTIDNFEECVNAGNPVMESYPRQCNANGRTFVEEIEDIKKHVCTAEEKAAEACTLEYAPVYGDDGVTYGNKCSACGSKKIDNYVPGECQTKTDGETGKLKANDCTEPRTQACTKEYVPVCGWFNLKIQCLKYPCADNYANKCSACADASVAYWTEGKCPTSSDGSEGAGSSEPGTGSAGIANPASTYCIEQGGESEIKTSSDGSQYGICRLKDGRECDEWIYFRSSGAECKPVTEYTVAEKLNVSCSRDEECATPMNYLILSHCPYTSKCLNNSCAVVCPHPFSIPGKPEPFCGKSTSTPCKTNSDCTKGGCSGQICTGKGDNGVSTCEYRDCYNAASYNLSCGCVENKCKWN